MVFHVVLFCSGLFVYAGLYCNSSSLQHLLLYVTCSYVTDVSLTIFEYLRLMACWLVASQGIGAGRSGPDSGHGLRRDHQ